jgi:hypothetical protein
MLEWSTGRWVAYVRLEDPPGLATDEVWAAR